MSLSIIASTFGSGTQQKGVHSLWLAALIYESETSCRKRYPKGAN
jgi:hypothetical protein